MTTVRTGARRPAAADDPAAHVRTGSGPGDALRDLYHHHAAALLAYAEHVTGDRQAAEDAVQETFLRAWRHLPRLGTDARSLRPWLRQVLRNILIDAARAAEARPLSLLEDALLDREVDGGFDGVLDRGLLVRALRQLSPAHRQVLLDVYYHDLPSARVAARMGIPAGTIRSRLHYALRAVRAQLGDCAPVPTCG